MIMNSDSNRINFYNEDQLQVYAPENQQSFAADLNADIGKIKKKKRRFFRRKKVWLRFKNR